MSTPATGSGLYYILCGTLILCGLIVMTFSFPMGALIVGATLWGMRARHLRKQRLRSQGATGYRVVPSSAPVRGRRQRPAPARAATLEARGASHAAVQDVPLARYRVEDGGNTVHHRSSVLSLESVMGGFMDGPSDDGVAEWIPGGKSVTVAGHVIPGGMLYLGSAHSPETVDPGLTVARGHGNPHEPIDGYWPWYRSITPRQRLNYLTWLAGNRREPAYIGYVFLYFYGLERRMLVDPSPEAHADLPGLVTEVRSLLSAYGENGSFRRYATDLLGFVIARSVVATGKSTAHDPLTNRILVARRALDGVPVDAELAWQWAITHPGVGLSTPVTRCRDEAHTLFIQQFQARYPKGLALKPNRTPLTLHYRPASNGLPTVEYKPTPPLPDLESIEGPRRALAGLMEEVAASLSRYSRQLGSGVSPDDPAAQLLLDPALWSPAFTSRIDALLEHDECRVMTAESVEASLGCTAPLRSDRWQRLGDGFAVRGIGIEPDPRKRKPAATACLALYRTADAEGDVSASAELCIDLACACALADGELSDSERHALDRQIETWPDLASRERCRLKARVKLAQRQPPQLSSKLLQAAAQLPEDVRRKLAELAVQTCLTPTGYTPGSEARLRKLHQRLDLSLGEAAAVPITLDHARIRALQAETERASALLADVFVDDAQPPPQPSPTVEGDLQGFDGPHLEFLRALCGKAQWSREDLEAVAAPLGLMVDGELERINDYCFDAFDAPLTEGEDPIELVVNIAKALKSRAFLW